MTVESRIFSVAEYVQPSEGEPIRSVVLETRDSIIVVWHVHPGQEIAAHIHPHGQDTWTVLGTVAKLAMRQPFVLFKGLTFQKLCLP
ncbi:hypothetical protein RAH16_26905, partial [Klebsiella pneumoniae]